MIFFSSRASPGRLAKQAKSFAIGLGPGFDGFRSFALRESHHAVGKLAERDVLKRPIFEGGEDCIPAGDRSQSLFGPGPLHLLRRGEVERPGAVEFLLA